MAYSDFDGFEPSIEDAVEQARRSARVQRVQIMLLAACLTTLGVVGVAGALLTNLV